MELDKFNISIKISESTGIMTCNHAELSSYIPVQPTVIINNSIWFYPWDIRKFKEDMTLCSTEDQLVDLIVNCPKAVRTYEERNFTFRGKKIKGYKEPWAGFYEKEYYE